MQYIFIKLLVTTYGKVISSSKNFRSAAGVSVSLVCFLFYFCLLCLCIWVLPTPLHTVLPIFRYLLSLQNRVAAN